MPAATNHLETDVHAEPTLAGRLEARVPNGRRPQVIHQRWRSLLFLHWTYPADELAEFLPEGLSVDTYDGNAYVSITPLFIKQFRPVYCPPVPWVSYFSEINVRTYVFDRFGTPGIWFFVLECNQPLAVWGAKTFFHLPYTHSKISATSAGWIHFMSRRQKSSATANYQYRPRGVPREAEPGSLEFFLLERYYLFSYADHQIYRAQVSHAPYRYQHAICSQFSTVPARLAGLKNLAGSPVQSAFADCLDVKTFSKEPVL